MAINNVYNQTPKRIFTNKPFVKGMSYTNADMSPYVCRSVANLDMESSSTATHIRQGVYNKKVYENAEVLKFFDKYLIIPNVTTEIEYRNNTTYASSFNNNLLGIKVVSSDFETEYTVYPSIIYNDTTINYDGRLSHIGNALDAITVSSSVITILKLNNGRVPYTINSNNKSISFFGSIHSIDDSDTIYTLYTGLITVYFHESANTAIVEIINPTITNPEDVINYGTNVLAKNPLIYRDYVSIPGDVDTYLEYAGNVSDKLIDITTVQVYDAPVDPVGLTTNSTANLVNGFDKDSQEDIFIRPYVVLPKGDYNAILKANVPGTSENEYYYNFNDNIFVRDPVTKTKVNSKTYDGYQFFDNTIDHFEKSGLKTSATNIVLNSTGEDIKDFPIEIEVAPNVRMCSPISTDLGKFINIKSYNSIRDGFETVVVNSATLANLLDSECEDWDKLILSPVIKGAGEVENIYSPMRVMSQVRYTTEYTHFNTDKSISKPLPGQISVDTFLFRTFNDTVDTSDFFEFGYRVYTDSDLFDTVGDTELVAKDVYSVPITDYVLMSGVHKNNVLIRNGNSWRMYEEGRTFTAYTGSAYMADSIEKATAVITYTLRSEPFGLGTYKIIMNGTITYNSDNVHNYDNYGDYTVPLIQIKNQVYPFAKCSYTTNCSLPLVCNVDLSDSENVSLPLNAKIRYTFEPEQLKNIVYDYDCLKLICSSYFNSSTDTHFSNIDDIMYDQSNTTITGYMNKFNLNKDYYINDIISLTLPNISVYEYVFENVISDQYVLPIQHVQNNIMTADYNLRIKPYALQHISRINDSGAVTFTVIISPKAEQTVIDSADNVSATSAIIKTYESDIIKYDALANETNFKNGIDNVAMHLGYYVFWGKETKSNTLFYSEFNNPAYIPSMYMIDFDKPIVHIHPHQGNLIVFTTDDIHMLHSGNVPSTTAQDGSEVAFTQSLIQANTRLGYANIDTVKSIGKDVFFITEQGDGYLLKTNRYVSNSSDTYLIKITHQIEDLLKNPFRYCLSRADSYNYNLELGQQETFIHPDYEELYGTHIENLFSQNPQWSHITIDTGKVRVIDGDTFTYDEMTFRLADINTPEIASNERLSLTAKTILNNLLNSNNKHIHVFYKDNLVDPYGRYIANVMTTNESTQYYKFIYVNRELLRLGLAFPYMLNAHTADFVIKYSDDGTAEFAPIYLKEAINYATVNNLGVYNNIEYGDHLSIGTVNYPIYDVNTYHLSTYATNNYIYIIQSVFFKDAKGMTIIYKYNIDSRTWTTYDFIGAVCPVDIVADNTKTGFSMVCNNKGKSFINQAFSILTFLNNTNDINEVAETNNNIHAYFDTGNQGISIMNEKLFREFKLSLGSSDSSELDINYKIKVFVDGKEVTGRDKYLKGEQEIDNGFKKITLLTPCRGRIPRYTVDIECKSDVNILEYAIVYLQLNAK